MEDEMDAEKREVGDMRCICLAVRGRYSRAAGDKMVIKLSMVGCR